MNDFEGGHNYTRSADPLDVADLYERMVSCAAEHFSLPETKRLHDEDGLAVFMIQATGDESGMPVHELNNCCQNAILEARVMSDAG